MKTGKPELVNGYLRIANELHEAISKAKFTQYERSLIDLILRLSYGCNKSISADILHWSDLKVVGIPKQHARATAETLREKKVIKITYPSGRIRFRLNKYYLQWQVPLSEEQSLYNKLIFLNTTNDKPLDDFGNTGVTEENDSKDNIDNGLEGNGNTSVTFEASGNTSVTEKVTQVLPKSNTSVTETGDRSALPLELHDPKDIKDIIKENPPLQNTNCIDNNSKEDAMSDEDEDKLKLGRILELFQRAAPGWVINNLVQQEMFDNLMEYPEVQITMVLQRAAEEGVNRTKLLGWVVKGLDNFDRFYSKSAGIGIQKREKTKAEELEDYLKYCAPLPNKHDQIYPALLELAELSGEAVEAAFARCEFIPGVLGDYMEVS